MSRHSPTSQPQPPLTTFEFGAFLIDNAPQVDYYIPQLGYGPTQVERVFDLWRLRDPSLTQASFGAGPAIEVHGPYVDFELWSVVANIDTGTGGLANDSFPFITIYGGNTLFGVQPRVEPVWAEYWPALNNPGQSLAADLIVPGYRQFHRQWRHPFRFLSIAVSRPSAQAGIQINFEGGALAFSPML